MTDWRERAACKGVDSAYFFAKTPEGGTYQRMGPWYRTAAALCAGCPVRADCLADALAHEPKPRFGYRGVTSQERTHLAGERPRACERCDGPVGRGGHATRYCSPQCRAAAKAERAAS